MLHTLLPLPERKALKAEYRVRMAIVLCFMLCLSGVIGIAALFPAFIHAGATEETAMKTTASLKKDKDQSGLSKVENELALDKTLLSALKDNSSSSPLDSLIQNVVKLRGSLIITSLSLSKQATSTIDINILGIAPTRDSLTSFKTKLESAVLGNKVDLPVGELAKSTNIQFSLIVHWIIP